MTAFPIRTTATAPDAARPTLERLQETFGMIPNVAGAMANSPELLRAFAELFGHVHSGTFTEAEIQTVLLTNAVTNACNWAASFHTMLALQQGLAAADVEAIRTGAAPGDARLAALSALARRLIETRGHVDAADLDAFTVAGFRPAQALEIVAISAASTMTNYVGTLTGIPLEDFLRPHAWPA